MADVAELTIRTRPGTQTWLMNFPPVNAIGPEFLDAMVAAFDAAEADPDMSVLVLGSSLNVFSAGADATWMANVVAKQGAGGLLEVFNHTMDRFRELCARLRSSRLLVIAALQGHTLAGGLELAAACDLRFAGDDDRVKIGVPEMALFGCLPSGGGGTQFLSRLMGASQALRFILDADPVTPALASSLGLVDRIGDAGSVLEDAEAFAAKIAERAGPVGINAAKRAVLDLGVLRLDDALRIDHELHWDAMRRGNFLVNVGAFVDRFGSKEAGG